MIYIPNRVLICSSATFLISSYYGYTIQNSLYKLDLISSLFSIIYWSDSDNKYKRLLDITTANITGIAFFTYGYYTIKGSMRHIAWFNLFGILSNFTLSCIKYKQGYSKWYYYHFMFHMFTLLNKFIVYNS